MAQLPLVVFSHHASRSCVEYLRVPGRAGVTPRTIRPHQLGRVLPI